MAQMAQPLLSHWQMALNRLGLLVVFFVFGFLGTSKAATWTDPNFDQTIQLSKFIGVLENTGQVGPNGAHTLMFKAIESWKSDVKKGQYLEVTGHFDRETDDPPQIPEKQRFVAFLDFRQGVWTALTPSIGLLAVQGRYVMAVVRDTSLRMPVRLDKYRALTRAIAVEQPKDRSKLGKTLLQQSRLVLKNTGQLMLSKAQIYKLIFALEVLARFATPQDLAAIAKFQAINYFQVRASVARALAAIETEESVEILLKLTQEGQALVSAWAGFSLLTMNAIPKASHQKLIEACRSASVEDVALYKNVTDPRRNRLPACKTSLLRLLGKQKIQEGLTTLKDHLTHDKVEVVKAALAALVNFEDPKLCCDVVEAMPESAERAMFFNRLFLAALRKMTGSNAGHTKSAWQKWLKNHPDGQ